MNDEILKAYEQHGSIRGVVNALNVSHEKVRRVLITNGVYSSPRWRAVLKLLAAGKTIPEIAAELGVTASCINGYLPYSRGPYKHE